jgi:peptide/nickel transport system permease protein
VSTVTVPLRESEASIARRETLGQLARSKTFLIGALVLAFWVFWALAGSHLTPQDPLAQGTDILLRPGGAHWLGTDTLGRDVLSRVLEIGRAHV